LIFFVVTPEHPYTFDAVLAEAPKTKPRVITYDEIFRRAPPALATYVFTDLDRLPRWRVREAALLCRRLRDGGARVLNDPARMRSRYGLLRGLHLKGLNRFNAWRVEDEALPERWPVFLRAEGDHDGPLSGLLHNAEEARAAIEQAIAAGAPVTNLLLVEYCAEEIRPGLFRKLGMYRMGEAYFAALSAHEDDWVAKRGKTGIAPAELYDEELRTVRENSFEADLRPVFEFAGVEYGRADFSLVGGKVQTYEINSNPHNEFQTEHPHPARLESFRLFKQNFFAALAAIDSGPPPRRRLFGRLGGRKRR
jgi:hypothetical protein